MSNSLKRLGLYILVFGILEILVGGYLYQDLLEKKRRAAATGEEARVKYEVGAFYEKLIMATLLAALGLGFVYNLNRNRKALAQSKHQLQAITDSMREGLFVLNAYKTITFANPAAEKLLKYAPGELTGKTIHTVFPHHTEECPICRTVERGAVLHSDELAIRTKQEAPLSVEFTISPLFDQLRQVSGAVVAFHDITRRKQDEESLAEERNLLRTLIQTIPDPVYLKDAAGRYLMVNRAFIELFQQPDEHAILGKTIFDFLPADEAKLIMEFDLRSIAAGEPILGEEVFFRALAHEGMWASRSTAPLRRESGEIFGMVGLNRDITRQKRAEEQLLAANQQLQDKNRQLAELNASKDKFFSIISHDLRSPFNTLLGFTQLLAENLVQYSQEEIRRKVERIRTSAEALYALLENLLTWARMQRGMMQCEPETFDLMEMAADTLNVFLPKAEQKRIALQSTIPPGTVLYADFSMTHTILRNLIANALKFTKSGGSVTVSAVTGAQMVEITVRDTGAGIDAAGLAKLFRIDTQYTQVGTAGEHGTGLGLNLCKDLVEKNGGEIWVASVVGQGSAFTFTLPHSSP